MARKPAASPPQPIGPAPTLESTPVLLVAGDDDFGIQQRGRQVWDSWQKSAEGLDHEIIDGTAANSGEALRAIGRLREALQTLPFFGGPKLVWFRACNFLGEDRTGSSNAVTEELSRLADEWKTFKWTGVRLLITATKPDKRRAFFKTIDRLFLVEILVALSSDDNDWPAKAEAEAIRYCRANRCHIEDEALGQLVSRVGPNLRLLHSELEKLSLYSLGRESITTADVEAVIARQKTSRAFALGEALGDRNLAKALKTLDEELWEIRAKVDRSKSEIGLLYGLISKIRSLILTRELARMGYLKPASHFAAFKSQLEAIPPDQMPQDKRYNPLLIHSYVLFQAARQSRNYQTPELVLAMERLLEANRKLVSSSADEARVLQQVLVEIIGVPAARPR